MLSMHGENIRSTSLLIIELHDFEPKLLVNYLQKYLQQVVKKNDELYPFTRFFFCLYLFHFLVFKFELIFFIYDGSIFVVNL
jgi:hypothetical protein